MRRFTPVERHSSAKRLITYYCPACWHEMASRESRCPVCGFDLEGETVSFEEKLLASLEHPVPEKRLLAIQILGNLRSRAALPGLEKLLDTEVNDIYALREALMALSKIEDPRSQELLQKACHHPYALISQLAQTLLNRQNSPKRTHFILVRHGQTEWNRIERFRGRADLPLNETGLAQAEAAAQKIAAGWKPAAIYSSPLSRALQTAEAIARHTNLPVQAHPGLIDIDYGEWQGLTPDEARQRWHDQVDAWYQHPEQAHIPGGETLDDLRLRAMQAVNELASLHLGETIVLVSHTVINRIILLGVLGLGNERFWNLQQDNCAINQFVAEQGNFILVSLNDTCHLSGAVPLG